LNIDLNQLIAYSIRTVSPFHLSFKANTSFDQSKSVHRKI